MTYVKIRAPRGAQGPRVEVTIDGHAREFTVSEATDLYRALGDALLVVAARYCTVDQRIDDLFDKEDG